MKKTTILPENQVYLNPNKIQLFLKDEDTIEFMY